MKCTACQHQLPDDAKFCLNCGQAVAPRAAVKVDQQIGSVAGAVTGVSAPATALGKDLSVSASQKVDTVTEGGAVTGAVFGGPGTTTIGGQHTHSTTTHNGDSITVGNISGSNGVAIGAGASASVTYGANDAAHAELQQLLADLKSALERAPAAQAADAEAVSVTAAQAVEQATREKPNKSLVQISAEGLKQAAKNLADVLPDVLPIATKIAAAIAKFVV